jgi:hypothetical protein
MKRAISYSDSFLVLGGAPPAGAGPTDGLLTPIFIPISRTNSASELGSIQHEASAIQHKPSRSKGVLCFLFTFKGGLHIFLISAFETLFYFLYVNRSENEGIRKTIDTYYQPLVLNCNQTWSSDTRDIMRVLLSALVNQTTIDSAGTSAYLQREAYNNTLLSWSIAYSGIFATCCIGAAGYVKWAGWIIPWRRIVAENLLFVFLLALYEVFFFRTIIYNYETLSTAELNQYIVDGLETCAAA